MDKLKQWVALTVLGALAIAAGGWFVLVSPKRADAEELRTEASGIETSNATLKRELKVVQAQAKDLPKEKAKLAAVATKVPSNPALPGLIRAITRASDSSGVTFVSLTPSEPVLDASVPATTTGVLTRIPVEITVVGGYYQVQGMLSRLEALPRAYRVTNLALAPGAAPSDADADQEDGSSLESVITGEVFMATPAPITTAKAKPKAGAAGTSTSAAGSEADTTTSTPAGK